MAVSSKDLAFDEKSGCWYRVGSKDLAAVREGGREYAAVPVGPLDIVLDLGAHIGSSVRYFLRAGAVKVIAVEPEPDNYDLLQRNVEGLSVVSYNAAVGPNKGHTVLYRHPTEGSSHQTIRPHAKLQEEQVVVDQLPLGELLEEHRPQVLKCDIEFGEYGLPELLELPSFVRSIGMELHLRFGTIQETGNYRQLGRQLLDSFAKQGFETRSYRERTWFAEFPRDDGTGFKRRAVAAVLALAR